MATTTCTTPTARGNVDARTIIDRAARPDDVLINDVRALAGWS